MNVVTSPCIVCGERSNIEVDFDSYISWQKGTLIQNAFPNESTGFRELIKTGTHDACWETLTKE
jgi:hypothetical protein